MSQVLTFGQRLDTALSARGSLCVGIDPHSVLLEQWGLPVDADGLARFADICVRAFAGQVAVVKPQSAFFEVFGAAGMAVLERTLAACRSAGALVCLDVKRGDIGSTMAAYAQAYLDPRSPLAADVITVSPYLGVGSLQPAFDTANEHGAGLFLLGLTSNPEGPQMQRARAVDGRALAQVVADEVGARNAGATPVGSFGLVVGATIGGADDAAVPVDLSAVHGPFLVPGVGAQGGTADDVRRIFADGARYVLPSVSREVLRNGPDVAAMRGAAEALVADFSFPAQLTRPPGSDLLGYWAPRAVRKVAAMDAKVSREHAESVLAHVGAPKDRIQAILEDIDFPIDRDELMNILQARGVTHDGLTNRMGGSP